MLVTVLHRLENTPAGGTSTFPDVAAGTWYTDAVAWAADNGIVTGTGAGFNPNGNVTREQLAAILYRYAQTIGINTDQKGDLSSFSDNADVSSWAQDAMSWAVGAGLINGKTNGKLDPAGNTTRAEVAAILMRMCGYMAK